MNSPRYRKISDLLIHPPRLIKNIFPYFIWEVNSYEKVMYLTFDDGPIPKVTEKILHALSFFDAKATFFCVGENVVRNPEIYEKILKGGHAVGNHTHSHLSGYKTGTNEYLDNVQKASKYINSTLFRPPHGRLKTSQSEELAKYYDIVLWDVLSYDFDKTKSKERCFSNVKHFARPGSIVVMHDSIKAKQNMFHTLTQTLAYFSSIGYRFEALTSELFRTRNISVHTEKVKFAV